MHKVLVNCLGGLGLPRKSVDVMHSGQYLALNTGVDLVWGSQIFEKEHKNKYDFKIYYIEIIMCFHVIISFSLLYVCV